MFCEYSDSYLYCCFSLVRVHFRSIFFASIFCTKLNLSFCFSFLFLAIRLCLSVFSLSRSNDLLLLVLIIYKKTKHSFFAALLHIYIIICIHYFSNWSSLILDQKRKTTRYKLKHFRLFFFIYINI